jgi:ATP-dependent DNA helicase DinG
MAADERCRQYTGVTEKVEAPRQLDDALKAGIREAYAALQANTPGFSTRRSQSQMIGVVSRALARSGGC